MEQTVSTMLDSMISTTDDPEITEMLQEHKRQTQEHERRLRERLDAMGAGTSATKSVGGLGAALIKGVGDIARADKHAKNGRDGFMTEHMEIAAYELLDRLAKRAGDEKTAEVARRNRADEREMAKKIESNWERFLDLTLARPGLLGGLESIAFSHPVGSVLLRAASALLFTLGYPTSRKRNSRKFDLEVYASRGSRCSSRRSIGNRSTSYAPIRPSKYST